MADPRRLRSLSWWRVPPCSARRLAVAILGRAGALRAVPAAALALGCGDRGLVCRDDGRQPPGHALGRACCSPLVFAVGAALAFYHVGVEQHWFAGPSACTGRHRRRRHGRGVEGADPAPAAGALRRGAVVARGGFRWPAGTCSPRWSWPASASPVFAHRGAPLAAVRRGSGMSDARRAPPARRPRRRPMKSRACCGSITPASIGAARIYRGPARRARTRPRAAGEIRHMAEAGEPPPRPVRDIAARAAGPADPAAPAVVCRRLCARRRDRAPRRARRDGLHGRGRGGHRRALPRPGRLPRRRRSRRCGSTILSFRDDEFAHRDTALAHGAEETPGYDLIGAAVKTGSRLAIWLSTRL